MALSRLSLKSPSWRSLDKRITLLFAVPALLLLALMTFWPLVQLVLMSLRNYQSSLVNYQFVGVRWYLEMWQDSRFLASLGRTLSFTTAAVTCQIALGMGMALVLNRDFFGIKIVRTLLLLPMVAMPVASALMWSIMYHPGAGVLNWMLKAVGLQPSLWLASPNTSLFPSLLIVEVWLGAPFAMLLILAGLRTMPEEPFEAAEIDGASSWQRFWYLTLPLVRPALAAALMFRLIDTLKQFAVIWVLTAGGPIESSETLYVYGYVRAFKYLDLGYGSAVLFAFVLMVIAVSLVAMRIERKAGESE